MRAAVLSRPDVALPGPLAVCTRGLRKAFRDGETLVAVLRDIALEIPADGISFLVGPSGCGKTTLISAIAGILRPDAGSVSIFGTDLTLLHGAALSRFRAETIGFIFQQFNLLPALTAVENASIPLLIRGQAVKAAERRAAAMLDRLGLGGHLHKVPAQLSGGQQQRVAIARALVHEPRLVVCDEPTAALDAVAGQTVMLLLREFAAGRGRGVIVVTHDDRIHRYADRIAFMNDGSIERCMTMPQPIPGELT